VIDRKIHIDKVYHSVYAGGKLVCNHLVFYPIGIGKEFVEKYILNGETAVSLRKTSICTSMEKKYFFKEIFKEPREVLRKIYSI